MGDRLFLAYAPSGSVEGSLPSAGRVPTLREWGARWLERRRREGSRGYRTDLSRWRTHLEPWDRAGSPLSSLTRSDVREWLSGRLQARGATPYARGEPGPLALQTVRNVLNLQSGKIRRVPLFGLARDALIAWCAYVGDVSLYGPLGIVFPAKRGGRRDAKPPADWASWCARASLTRRVRWHDFEALVRNEPCRRLVGSTVDARRSLSFTGPFVCDGDRTIRARGDGPTRLRCT